MTAISRHARVLFESPLQFGSDATSISIDMTSWTMNADFSKTFGLKDIDDGTGMIKREGATSFQEFATFQGFTLEEAQERFPIIAKFMEYRAKHGDSSYAQLDELLLFYEQLGKGNFPTIIELAEIEWY